MPDSVVCSRALEYRKHLEHKTTLTHHPDMLTRHVGFPKPQHKYPRHPHDSSSTLTSQNSAILDSTKKFGLDLLLDYGETNLENGVSHWDQVEEYDCFDTPPKDLIQSKPLIYFQCAT